MIGAISWLDSAHFTNATPALLHKALDRQHRGALNQFRRAKDAAGVLSLWQEAAKRGDIPGAYWAAITHPAATEVTELRGELELIHERFQGPTVSAAPANMRHLL